MSTQDKKLLKEAKKLPWEDRLLHKNWKVRNDANIDLAALCYSITDPKDHRIRELGHFFKKTVADSNAPVQDKALDALIAYLKAADADAGRFAKEVCDAVVAKCLTGRPKTVEKAQIVFMLWVELEAVDVFLDSMEKAIKNKVAKAVVPAIDVMFQALSEFGSKIVPLKRILKMLPELFDHQDQNVRASSKGLTLELCRWIGRGPVKSILFEKMRDTMKKELEAELANVTGSAKPTRKIRSEQDKEPEQEVEAEASGTGPSEESAAEIPQEIDEYELVDPVDILTPLEKSGFWNGVKATKWSERKDAVAELTKLASTKRIAPGDFTEICRTLKKLITDVNIAVAVEAVQAIGNLALGLRTNFSASSRFMLPVLLDKLKEKKPTMTEALNNTLQAVHKAGCVTLADIVEDVKLAVKNKVPLVRSLTLNWVTHCIETSNKAVILKVHKDYVPICMECLNDGTPDVRDAAFSVLAAIAKSVGMRPLEKSLEKLDDVRRKKLSEMIGVSGGGGPTVAGSAVPSSGGAVSSMEKNRAVDDAPMNNQKEVSVAPSETEGTENEVNEFTKEEVDALLNEKFKEKKFDSKGKQEWMTEYMKKLKVCIKWFQKGLQDLAEEKDKLREMLDSSERKSVETKATMKTKEEELNATISKLETNVFSLKESLAKEESEKLDALDSYKREKEARMASEKTQDSLREDLGRVEQNALNANEKVKTQEDMYKRLVEYIRILQQYNTSLQQYITGLQNDHSTLRGHYNMLLKEVDNLIVKSTALEVSKRRAFAEVDNLIVKSTALEVSKRRA